MIQIHSRVWSQILLLTLATVAVFSGCGSQEPKTYPVSGKITIAGDEANLLAGHVIEVSHSANPQVRAYSEIAADGSFHLESLFDGKIVNGAAKGEYLARLVLSDDDPARREQAAKMIPRKYFDFQASGLKLQAPADKEVSFSLQGK